jgi:hypothetical protein
VSSSKLDICNQALSHLAVSVEIQDFDAEKSKEAKACRRFYEPSRDKVLRDFTWPKLKTIEALALVEEFDSDENDFAFSYRYPANSVMLRRLFIPGSGRRETQITRVPYQLGRDSAGVLIYTDLEDAYCEYTYKETNEGMFDPDLVDAIAFLLASKIGPRVAGGDQFKLANRAYQFYADSIRWAQANARNEEQADIPPEGEFARAREGL